MLAYAQSLVLRRELPDFPAARWIAATSAAAALAWAIGMTPSALGGFAEEHRTLMIAGGPCWGRCC